MSKLLRDTVLHNTGFWWLAGAAITLFLIGVFIPPPGIIDSSVIYAVAELLGFAAIYTVLRAVDKGLDAKFQHGNTSVTISKSEDPDSDN